MNVKTLEDHPSHIELNPGDREELENLFQLHSSKNSSDIDSKRIYLKEVEMEMFALSLYAKILSIEARTSFEPFISEEKRIRKSNLTLYATTWLQKWESPSLLSNCRRLSFLAQPEDDKNFVHMTTGDIIQWANQLNENMLTFLEESLQCTEYRYPEILCEDETYLNAIENVDLVTGLPISNSRSIQVYNFLDIQAENVSISVNPMNFIWSVGKSIKRATRHASKTMSVDDFKILYHGEQMLFLRINLTLSEKQDICRRFVQTPMQNILGDPLEGYAEEEVKKDFAFSSRFFYRYCLFSLCISIFSIKYMGSIAVVIYFMSLFAGRSFTIHKAFSLYFSMKPIAVFAILFFLDVIVTIVLNEQVENAVVGSVKYFVVLSMALHLFLVENIPSSLHVKQAGFIQLFKSLLWYHGFYYLSIAALGFVFENIGNTSTKTTLRFFILAYQMYVLYIDIPSSIRIPAEVTQSELEIHRVKKMS